MVSVLRTAAPVQQPLSEASPKAKLKTILGRGAPTKAVDPSAVQRSSALERSHPSLSRRSVDTITDWQVKTKKSKAERPSTPDISFFEQDVVTVTKPSNVPDNEMKNGIAPRPSQRRPFRIDGQDGPWTISVAETPHDASSYSLYVKTPTHNLTLTRSALEIIEMHGKLRDAPSSAKLPALPIDPSSVPSPPPKRKSAFLNTLSRLASPSSSKVAARQASFTRSNTTSSSQASTSGAPSSAATPIVSPSQEINDPFNSLPGQQPNGVPAEPGLPPSNSTVTRLAAYLTAVANDATLRQTRTWKRFVRVRTDDLQSVRVERAIKRVRSDLAAHSSSSTPEHQRSMGQAMNAETARSIAEVPETTQDNVPPSPSSAASIKTPVKDKRSSTGGDTQSVQKEDGDGPSKPSEVDDVSVPEPATPVNAQPSTPESSSIAETPAPSTPAEEDVNEPSTPLADDASISHAARIPRSQSADPTSRASRILYSPSSGMSSPLRDGASSQASVTGDESSISTTGRRSGRKKRSKSTDPKKSQRKVVIDDFEMMRVLGKGCAGKVLLVRHKTTQDIFALKAITKRHVLAHQELQHTLTEQAVLKRMAAEGSDPFVVKLWWSFHDKENLFLVMDFHPGGDLATQLARWGRLGRDRARFYAAEIVEGVEGLHAAGVIYRDLKPENILIGADGHIVLTDFGLSKEFPRRTAAITAPPTPSGTGHRGDYMDGSPTAVSAPWMKEGWTTGNDTTSTFCGTAEYLAPEVIQGSPYSYEVDWWSFGTMLYEMLTGITPFWANNHSDMYYRVLQDELQFPEDRTMDQDTKSLIRGLLQRNPALRMKEPRIKKHPYFSMIDWSHVYYKRYIPPYIPPIDPQNASDTQNFDDTFLDMEPVIKDDHENDQTDTDNDRQTDAERTDGEDSVATPSQSRSPSIHPAEDETVDVFDGYSFKGRHSVIIDDEDEDAEGEESGEDDENSSLAAPSLDDILPQEPVSEDGPAPGSDMATVEEVPEPKTPEARTSALPDTAEVTTPVDHKPQAAEATPTEPSVPQKEVTKEPEEQKEPLQTKPQVSVVTKPAITRPVPRHLRNRREKSGIPALDRNLPDIADESGAATEQEEDDDWDFVETGVDEEKNGAKGTSLFARGVVDKYRLAVFRKSTPKRPGGRNVSGVSADLEFTEPTDSPTPSDKRRGRTPLTFRRHPKQFLRAKSPPSSTKSKQRLANSASTTFSPSTSSSAGVLTPSQSGTTLDMSPSLKSKESAISMGTQSESSDPSVNGDARHSDTIRASAAPEEEKQKSKGLRKGAEKVLSIFQSPR